MKIIKDTPVTDYKSRPRHLPHGAYGEARSFEHRRRALAALHVRAAQQELLEARDLPAHAKIAFQPQFKYPPIIWPPGAKKLLHTFN